MLSEKELYQYREAYQQRRAAQLAEREAHRLRVLAIVLANWSTIMADVPSLKRAYLFGSLIKEGRFRPDSDIDIAVDELAPEHYTPLWDALEDSLDENDWHMVDLRPLHPEERFAQRVIAEGILLYEQES